jgi:hypothetical protein
MADTLSAQNLDTLPVEDPSIIKVSLSENKIPVTIYAPSAEYAEQVQSAVEDLLIEFGFLEFRNRQELPGSKIIRFEATGHGNPKDVEHVLLVTFGSRRPAPSIEIKPPQRGVLDQLQRVLAVASSVVAIRTSLIGLWKSHSKPDEQAQTPIAIVISPQAAQRLHDHNTAAPELRKILALQIDQAIPGSKAAFSDL